MKTFSKLYSDFWVNPNNAELMQLEVEAKLMAIYLQGNSHHNMLGVYYLPTLYVASDLKQSVKKVQNALKSLCDVSYCKYDAKTQYIWVCNMALEQIGEEISPKDNRIIAIQAIWNSLPIQIEFLSEVHDKYHTIFRLEPRFISHSKSTNYKTSDDSSVIKLENIVEEHKEIVTNTNGISLSSINLNKNTNKEPSIDAHLTSIPPAIDPSFNLTSSFEGVSCNKKPLQSPPMVENSYNFNKTNILIPISKGYDTVQKDCLSITAHLDTITSNQSLVDKVADKNEEISSHPLEGVTNFSNTPSKDLTNPFATPSEGLQSPSEAPSETLRSNIEYISKNIEDINKKEEIEEEKEKKDINLNNVLIPDIVVQARPYVEMPSKIFNPSFSKQLKDQEETKKTEAVDAKKQLTAYQTCNLPVVTTASMLETNLASVFSVSSDISISSNASDASALCDNSVIPFIHIGSMDSDSDVSAAASADAIKVIFEHWKTVMQHPRSKLDCKRSSLIRKALKMGYTAQELCDAVTGCSITPHNMGENLQGQRYDGLHIIFKDADQIDRFIYNCHHPPKSKSNNEAVKRQEDNLHELNKWLESKNKSTETTENSFFQE
jgi:hypothetical protein